MSILTVDDLRARSERRPGDLCWHWLGAKASDGTPRMWTLDYDYGEKRTVSGPKAVWHISHGAGTRGRLVYRGCVCTDCVNPAHMRLALTKAEIGQHIRRNGARKGVTEARQRNIEKAWAATGLKVTPPEVVIAIRADSGTLAALGKKYGMSPKTVSRIRRGDSHRHLLGRQGEGKGVPA